MIVLALRPVLFTNDDNRVRLRSFREIFFVSVHHCSAARRLKQFFDTTEIQSKTESRLNAFVTDMPVERAGVRRRVSNQTKASKIKGLELKESVRHRPEKAGVLTLQRHR